MSEYDKTTDRLIKVDSALDYLNEFAPSLYANVLNLGKVEITNKFETAAVGLSHEGDRLEFLMGQKMLDAITPEQLGTVLVHESMHVLLNHTFAYESFADQDQVNKAMDALINDFLIKNNFEMPTGEYEGYSGINQLGVDCSNKTISEIIQLIEEQPQDKNGDGDGEGEGDPQSGQGGSSGEGFDKHEWMKDLSDQDKQKMQDIADGKGGDGDQEMDVPSELDSNKEDPDDHNTSSARGLESGGERDIIEAGIGLKWVELLRRIDPDIIPEPSYMRQNVSSWNRINRKIYGMYPDVLLPTYQNSHDREGWGNVKPSIVMCLDTSGSVSQDDVAMFLALARSIPKDNVDIKLMGFHSRAYDIDIDKPRLYSGGTRFGDCFQKIMKDVANGNPSEFPKAVILITDMCDNYGPGYSGYSSSDKWPMYETIKKHKLENNFHILHNYTNNSSARIPSNDRFPFNRNNVCSMYDLMERKNLKKLTSGMNTRSMFN